MKTIIILACLLVARAIAAPQGEVTITQQEESNNIGIGGYRFAYTLSDGQQRSETAELKDENTENEALSIVGSYSFVGPDGKTYKVDYTADKDGFHPTVSIV